MKISRRDLRKIILESILSEQESRTGSFGAEKLARRMPDVPDVIRKGIERRVKEIVDNFVGDEAFNAGIHVGRLSIKVRRPDGNVDVKKLERALKKGIDDDRDSDEISLRRRLRPGRSVIVAYEKEAGSAKAKVSSEEAVEDSTGTSAASATSTDASGTSKERARGEGIYELQGDSTYVYRVSSKGHWETQKKNGGETWISLKGNQAATNKLDRAHPNARSDDMKSSDKASSRAGSSGNTSRGSTDKSALDAAFTEAEIRYIPKQGMPKNVHIYQGKYRDLKDFAEAMNATLPSYLKNAGDEQGFYLYYVADTNRVYLVDVAAFRSTGVLPQFNLKKGFSVEARKIQDRSVDPTRDAAGFVKVISQLGSDNNVSESLSRGSLIRRRYRRY